MRGGARRKFVRADFPPPLFSHEGVKARAFEIGFGFAERGSIRERPDHNAKQGGVGTLSEDGGKSRLLERIHHHARLWLRRRRYLKVHIAGSRIHRYDTAMR